MKAGWQTSSVGNYCEVIAGQSPEGKYYNSDGNGMPFYQGKKDFGERFIEAPSTWTTEVTKTARKNDILMSVRAPVGPVNFATGNICIGRGLAAIRSGGQLDSDFLFYQLLHLQPNISGSEGAVFASINKSEIAALPIAYAPLPEQQRIVAILDEAFDNIATAKAAAEKNLQNARALFESHLQSVFSERGDGWVEETVGELVEDGVLVKPFDGNHGEIHPHKSDYVESGVPFVMACDLQNGGVDTEGCKFIPRKLADSLRVGFARDGDVLVSHKGTIGRSAVVNTDLDYIMLTPQITSYRIKDGSVLLNRFVRYYFMSPNFQHEMIAGAADGATRAYIGITKQLSLRIRFPSLEEQKRIVGKLDVLDPETQRLESLYRQKLAALDELKKSLLHQAFSGQL